MSKVAVSEDSHIRGIIYYIVLTFIMPGLELFIFGLTAAFMSGYISKSPTIKPSEQQSSRTTSAADKLFLVHQHSFFNDPLSGKAVNDRTMSSHSFDDQVEDLLDNPW